MRISINIKVTLICFILYSTTPHFTVAFGTQSEQSDKLSLLQQPSVATTNGQDVSMLYHTTDALISKIRSLCSRCPLADAEWTIVTSPTIKANHNDKSIPRRINQLNDGKDSQNAILTITLTHDAKARNAARREGKAVRDRTSIVATFGEHGRELITSELALRIIERICGSGMKTFINDDEDSEEDNINGVNMRDYEFFLVPLVNEDGRRAVERGDSCRRLNGRAVDLNRNYRYMWGTTDAATVHEEEQAGHSPLSEYETRAVDAMVRRFRPKAYISVHSGATAVLHPWDSGAQSLDTSPAHSWLRAAARLLGRVHCGACATGSAGSTFGYRAYGTGVDHMLAERGVPLALTVEIFGGVDSDCHTMFNPTSYHHFNEVMFNWSSLFSTTSRILALQPSFLGAPASSMHIPLPSLRRPHGGGHRSAEVRINNVIKDVLTVEANDRFDAYCVHWIADDLHFPNAASLIRRRSIFPTP